MKQIIDGDAIEIDIFTIQKVFGKTGDAIECPLFLCESGLNYHQNSKSSISES